MGRSAAAGRSAAIRPGLELDGAKLVSTTTPVKRGCPPCGTMGWSAVVDSKLGNNLEHSRNAATSMQKIITVSKDLFSPRRQAVSVKN